MALSTHANTTTYRYWSFWECPLEIESGKFLAKYERCNCSKKTAKNGLWLELKTMFRLFHCIFYVAVFCRDVLFWKSGGTNLAQIAASNCFQETHKLCTPPHLRVWECLSLIDSVRDAVKNYLADFFLLRVYPRPPRPPTPLAENIFARNP